MHGGGYRLRLQKGTGCNIKTSRGGLKMQLSNLVGYRVKDERCRYRRLFEERRAAGYRCRHGAWCSVQIAEWMVEGGGCRIRNVGYKVKRSRVAHVRTFD